MSDTDLFREVEEDLQRERLEKLWKQYGAYVVGALALIVALFGGYQLWQYQAATQAAANGAKFVAAADLAREGKAAEAEAALKALAGQAKGTYAVLAQLRLADAAGKAGKGDEAFASYEAIGKNLSVDQTLRQFAEVQAATLRLDKADWTEMQNRLTVLASAGSAWRHSARELLGISAWKAGKFDEAETQFQLILSDQATPKGLSQRAQIMLDVILAQDTKPPVTGAKPANATPAAGSASGG